MNKSLLNQYHDSLCYTRMDLLHDKTLDALTLLVNTETKMVEVSEGKQGNPAIDTESIVQTENGSEIRYSHLLNPFNKAPVRDFLMPGCPVRQEMNNAMAEYINYVTNLAPGKDSGKFTGLLDPSVYLPGNIPESDNLSLLSALHSIEILKNNLLAVESCMLTYIAKH
jgi:hypothetical protein